MAEQLRIYTIEPGGLADWVTEWRTRIKPLRCKLGFEVLIAWTEEDKNRFCWILKYDGPESWEKLDAAFHQSPERRSMRPDPARLIVRAEQYFLDTVD